VVIYLILSKDLDIVDGVALVAMVFASTREHMGYDDGMNEINTYKIRTQTLKTRTINK
jgi:hypothetical protein